jgi:hypothetical protein
MTASVTKDCVEIYRKEPDSGESLVFSEQPADDGWPEDAGRWPIGTGIYQHPGS